MTYINYLYVQLPIGFLYARCTFINFLYASVFLVLYKKKFTYATILTNLTNTLLGFCVYKIFLTYASFSVIFSHIYAKIFSLHFVMYIIDFLKKFYVNFLLICLLLQIKFVYLQYEFNV